ncbi:hypothetical protein T4B_13502 [Trichinella pseudospiralis]|uniref:Uncharacterized protein n=1 Tax=Trichinella pseudospiralis TaxID=6337 RepID=A0A0V1JB09_TRIPS|nr:hypothetical protein T4B_13502 [Trichinella pseudospiralis]KRZ44920.1 hypothetical protein T4C_4626 [Trichinella pseudospiralis]
MFPCKARLTEITISGIGIYYEITVYCRNAILQISSFNFYAIDKFSNYLLFLISLISIFEKKRSSLNRKMFEREEKLLKRNEIIPFLFFSNKILFTPEVAAGTGWRHLVIAVWCFDGSIGQYDGEFFFLVAQAPVLDLTVGQFVDPCFG